jgi:hypothetical protein
MTESLAAAVSPGAGKREDAGTETARRVLPAVVWAGFGALCLATALYVWISWITGPYFKRVEAGPTEPADWMKAVLTGTQIVLPIVALVILYFMLFRPWRRTGWLTTSGLLVICFGLTWWQEPFSDYYGHWLTYNSYLFNRGSWAQELPGWLSAVSPGHTVVVPPLITGPMYMSLFVVLMFGTAWVMRALKRRYPRLTTLHVIAITLVAGTIFDVVLEGLIFMPLGYWEYPGGIGPSIFPDSYHKMPLLGGLIAAAFWVAMASLVYFLNDRGENFAERGLHRIKGSERKRSAIRFLALLGGVNATVLVFNLPAAILVGPRVDEWPKDAQERSYLTYICGAGTNVICPGPGLPNDRGNDHFNFAGPDGTLRLQNGKTVRIVPYARKSAGPFSGPLFKW